MNEKVDPYMAPVWEALTDILGAEPLRRRRDRGEIEVAPIAFMRGRTLNHAFVIVDEAQNASRLQMKMVLTRLGEGARMAVTGDPSQVDLVNRGRLRPGPRGPHAGRRRGRGGGALRRRRTSCAIRWSSGSSRAYDADAGERRPMIEVEIADRGLGSRRRLDAAAWPSAAGDVGGARRAGDRGAASGDVAVLLTDDGVRELNARFRGKDRRPTCCPFPPRRGRTAQLGDIALAYGVCAREAAGAGQDAGPPPAASGRPRRAASARLRPPGRGRGRGHGGAGARGPGRPRRARSLRRARQPGRPWLTPTGPHRPQAGRSRGLRAPVAGAGGAARREPAATQPPPAEPTPASTSSTRPRRSRPCSVDDVMTPRADIVAVEIACPFSELLARFLEAEHTRMPIYRETLDDPVGQVHVKDVFKMLADEPIRPAPDEPVLRRLRREVLYVPGSMRAADLLVQDAGQPHPHGPGHRRVRRHRRPGHAGGPDRGGGRRDRRRARRGARGPGGRPRRRR